MPINTVAPIFDDRQINKGFLKSQWENPLLREAIFLASPYVHDELSKWYEGTLTDRLKVKRLEHTFLKYIIRISTRCTPFGLFSGISVGNFSEDSKIELSDSSQYNRHTRLDMNYMVTLINFFEKDKVFRNQLRYFPNNTLYAIANQYRYIEYKIIDGKRQYSLEAIEKSSFVEVVLKTSASGKSINELATTLIDETISKEEATEFINELIDNQILISELEPSVSGEESFDELLGILKSIDYKNTSKSLISLKNSISLLDEKITNSRKHYPSIHKILEDLEVSFDRQYVLQTDLFISTEKNNLNYKYRNYILNVLPILCKINSQNDTHKNLDQFKRRFVQRYETREIPLVQALDIETGIGYIQNNAVADTVPFLNDISPKTTTSAFKTTSRDRIHTLLHNKLLSALTTGLTNIILTDKDFSNQKIDWEKIPSTFSSLVEVTTLANQEFIIINSIGGTNAANLLARFCYGNEQIEHIVKDICSLEQELSNTKILTEIVHLPEARVGNILQRPHLRTYETPYLAKSNLSASNQINVNDISVSVKNDNIILKSKSLNKEISPRLTNAHNYSHKSLPIYHFLCDMQSQGTINNFGFSWNFLSESYPYLPRVTYKNIILSKARWYISREEIQEMMDNYENESALMNAVTLWKEKRNLPKLVQLKEGDNLLLISLENIDTIKLLLQQVKSKKKCILEEFLLKKTTTVKRNNKRFANQFVFTFHKKTNT